MLVKYKNVLKTILELHKYKNILLVYINSNNKFRNIDTK